MIVQILLSPAAPAPTSLRELGHPRRWAVLAVICLAVFVTVLDGTIVNVALPSLVVDLGASTRQLQWIVDAYLLVFTGLLLAAGGLGDRYGRKKALVTGLVRVRRDVRLRRDRRIRERN